MKYCAECYRYCYDSYVRCPYCGGRPVYGESERDWDDDDQQFLADCYRIGMDYAADELDEDGV